MNPSIATSQIPTPLLRRAGSYLRHDEKWPAKAVGAIALAVLSPAIAVAIGYLLYDKYFRSSR